MANKGFNTIMDGCQEIIDNPILTVKEVLKAKKKDGQWITTPAELLGVGVLTTFATSVSFSSLMIPASWALGPFAPLVIIVYKFFRNKRNEKLEKERMLKEVIRKQQAAINRQANINAELERQLREEKAKNKRNEEEIKNLKEKLHNLEDLISILEQMKAA